jgi:hypothetical protein
MPIGSDPRDHDSPGPTGSAALFWAILIVAALVLLW